SSGPSVTYQSAGTYTARVTVTDNTGATASASSVISVAAPSSGSTTFKWLDWNIQVGKGTDNGDNLDRTATYIANMNPDVVTLCEVQRYSSDDQAQKLTDMLTQKTGQTWYFTFKAKYTGTTEGNLILSRFPFVSTSSLFLSISRSVAEATVIINGRTINIFATHLDPDSATSRAQQISELTTFISRFSCNNLVGGAFNAWPGASALSGMTGSNLDSWAEAANSGIATAYPDNPVDPVNTRTRRARIDYVFVGRNAPNIIIRGAQVPDIRDLSHTPAELLGTLDDKGVRPSDHNMSVMTFEVR